jgi:hypothetical protein
VQTTQVGPRRCQRPSPWRQSLRRAFRCARNLLESWPALLTFGRPACSVAMRHRTGSSGPRRLTISNPSPSSRPGSAPTRHSRRKVTGASCSADLSGRRESYIALAKAKKLYQFQWCGRARFSTAQARVGSLPPRVRSPRPRSTAHRWWMAASSLATRAELAAKRADGMARRVDLSRTQKRRPALVGMLRHWLRADRLRVRPPKAEALGESEAWLRTRPLGGTL